jgi:site-specific DNA-methyltransferase (adenine-specific)
MGNSIYCGDNLKILKNFIGSATVDFCYIDPPFNSQRNYYQFSPFLNKKDKDKAPTFIDTWYWDPVAEDKFQEIQFPEFPSATIALFRSLPEIIGRGKLLAYLVYLTLVVKEIHRVLKSTGSFYLHCDPAASHYLKLVLDTIFCSRGGQFQNEIIWSYRTGGASRKRFARKHDVIFFYTKSRQWTFHAPKEKSYMMHRYGFKKSNFQLEPETGRQYSLVYGRDVLEIPAIGSDSKERLGFPTQKPEALLSYLIQASSNPGDLVLDAYCGSGTTLVAAQRLDRSWIGIDLNPTSLDLSKQRLKENFGTLCLENLQEF